MTNKCSKLYKKSKTTFKSSCSCHVSWDTLYVIYFSVLYILVCILFKTVYVCTVNCVLYVPFYLKAFKKSHVNICQNLKKHFWTLSNIFMNFKKNLPCTLIITIEVIGIFFLMSWIKDMYPILTLSKLIGGTENTPLFNQ